MSNDECYLSEIYSGIQGEGPLVGVRQILIRFSMCDLRCAYCDTKESLVKQHVCNIESVSGSRDFIKVENPINSNDLISYVKNLNPLNHHSISITGGEPLLHCEFLKSFLPELKEQFKLPLYLETAGHRPKDLKAVINYFNYISMDFKLPSSTRSKELWDVHKKFLKISLDAKKHVWVKIVVTRDTTLVDLFISLDIVKSVCKNKTPVEIFLQPVTRTIDTEPPSEKELLKIHSKLLDIYPHVRVVPQMHVLMGQK